MPTNAEIVTNYINPIHNKLVKMAALGQTQLYKLIKDAKFESIKNIDEETLKVSNATKDALKAVDEKNPDPIAVINAYAALDKFQNRLTGVLRNSNISHDFWNKIQSTQYHMQPILTGIFLLIPLNWPAAVEVPQPAISEVYLINKEINLPTWEVMKEKYCKLGAEGWMSHFISFHSGFTYDSFASKEDWQEWEKAVSKKPAWYHQFRPSKSDEREKMAITELCDEYRSSRQVQNEVEVSNSDNIIATVEDALQTTSTLTPTIQNNETEDEIEKMQTNALEAIQAYQKNIWQVLEPLKAKPEKNATQITHLKALSTVLVEFSNDLQKKSGSDLKTDLQNLIKKVEKMDPYNQTGHNEFKTKLFNRDQNLEIAQKEIDKQVCKTIETALLKFQIKVNEGDSHRRPNDQVKELLALIKKQQLPEFKQAWVKHRKAIDDYEYFNRYSSRNYR